MNLKWLFYVLVLAIFIFPSRLKSKEQAIKFDTTKQKLNSATKSKESTEVTKNSPNPKVEINQPSPRISFEKTVHNFGELAVGEKKECEFRFKNTGQELLKIQRIKKSCACAVSDMSKKDYKPGEEGIIKIKYNGRARAGSVTNYIFVKTIVLKFKDGDQVILPCIGIYKRIDSINKPANRVINSKLSTHNS